MAQRQLYPKAHPSKADSSLSWDPGDKAGQVEEHPFQVAQLV